MKINSADYKKSFGIGGADSKLLAKALEHAMDNRKFEIELYWKRATYFWTLIAAAFAGYFAILATNTPTPGTVAIVDKSFLAFAVSCIGFVFTFAWFQVNRGSKQWQENWENHVDMLEDEVTGPLYKTILRRPADSMGFVDRFVTGPSNISVSKVNQMVNLFTLCVWALLAVYIAWPIAFSRPISWPHWIATGTTAAFCVLILVFARTYGDDHKHSADRRTTSVLD